MSDRVAIVTGAASGIGAATARLFISEGARVMVGDIQDEAAQDLVGELGPSARYTRCDVTQESDIAELIDATTRAWGRVDVLHNNAGVVGARGPLESTSVEDYDTTMNILLRSAFLGIKHVAPHMKAAGSGSIVSTSSICGLMPGQGTHLYTVAKAGIIMLTKTAALELAEHNIRVNCICPGFVATQMAAGAPISQLSADENERRLEHARSAYQGKQPLGRMGEPEDVARAALYFASDDAEWVTGTSITVDGGRTLGKPWSKQPVGVTQSRHP